MQIDKNKSSIPQHLHHNLLRVYLKSLQFTMLLTSFDIFGQKMSRMFDALPLELINSKTLTVRNSDIGNEILWAKIKLWITDVKESILYSCRRKLPVQDIFPRK